MDGLTKLFLWGLGGLVFGMTLIFTISPQYGGIPVHTTDPDGRPYSDIPVWHQDYKTTYTRTYVSNAVEPPLESLQCPIPMEDRVRNHTGIQCVYSSTEALGRWAEEPKLVNPPLTSRSDCKGYSGPSALASRLNKLGVKFEQVSSNRAQALELLKKAMAEGRGALWGVPGHAMVICHYSEEEDRVCWFDNSDRSLKMQTTTVEKFKRRWDGWICVIYADNDLFPDKAHGRVKLPIRDHENSGINFHDKYIPMPLKKD